MYSFRSGYAVESLGRRHNIGFFFRGSVETAARPSSICLFCVAKKEQVLGLCEMVDTQMSARD